MEVNYMMELVALDHWELTHQLEPTAYKVLHKLYYLASMERFPERISIPNTMLTALVGCSEDSLIRARSRLINAGRIEYKGQKKLTPLYTINYFSLDSPDNSIFAGYNKGISTGINKGISKGISTGYTTGTYTTELEKKKIGVTEEDIPTGKREYRARGKTNPFPPRERALPLHEQWSIEGLLGRIRTSPMFKDGLATLEPMLESDRFSIELVVDAVTATERRNQRDYMEPLNNPTAYLMELLYDWEERGFRTSQDVLDAKGDFAFR